MYKPVSILGKLFKSYLLSPSHISKIRIQNVLGKWLFPSGIVMKNNEGVIFKLDPNDWMTRTIIEQGDYESGSVSLAKSLLKSGSVFIDIGANFGLYSCQLGIKQNDARLYAVEPNFQVLPRLRTNIQLNHLEARVNIINAAVSDKFQMVYLDLPEKNNLGTTTASLVQNGGVAVLSCPLFYLLNSNNIKSVDLIKIDIEGNEFSILADFPFEKIIIKNIILEFNFLSKVSFEQLNDFFDSNGFDLFTISGDKIFSKEKDILENNIWVVNRMPTTN